MKKVIAAGMALLLLAALSTAYASEAGTVTDPLITRSYADGTYADAVIKAGVEVIEERLEAFRALVEANPYAGLKLTATDGWEWMASRAGSAVTLVMGSSFMLTDGTATLELTSGEVIDVATGESVASGSTLRRYARYFCVEDTVAVFRSVNGIAFTVEGRMSADAGTVRQYQDYADVLGLEWYAEAAEYAKRSALYHDWEAETFRPAEYVTRAEFVYALWTACGMPESTYEQPFTDLTEDWYIPAVRWAAESGITRGVTDVLFSPAGGINREQMATMLYRCVQTLGGDISPRTDVTVYSDWEKISDWAFDSVSWCTALGYINGMGDGTVNPGGPTTRAQAATVIMRYAKAHISDVTDSPADGELPDDAAPAGDDVPPGDGAPEENSGQAPEDPGLLPGEDGAVG